MPPKRALQQQQRRQREEETPQHLPAPTPLRGIRAQVLVPVKRDAASAAASPVRVRSSAAASSPATATVVVDESDQAALTVGRFVANMVSILATGSDASSSTSGIGGVVTDVTLFSSTGLKKEWLSAEELGVNLAVVVPPHLAQSKDLAALISSSSSSTKLFSTSFSPPDSNSSRAGGGGAASTDMSSAAAAAAAMAGTRRGAPKKKTSQQQKTTSSSSTKPATDFASGDPTKTVRDWFSTSVRRLEVAGAAPCAPEIRRRGILAVDARFIIQLASIFGVLRDSVLFGQLIAGAPESDISWTALSWSAIRSLVGTAAAPQQQQILLSPSGARGDAASSLYQRYVLYDPKFLRGCAVAVAPSSGSAKTTEKQSGSSSDDDEKKEDVKNTIPSDQVAAVEAVVRFFGGAFWGPAESAKEFANNVSALVTFSDDGENARALLPEQDSLDLLGGGEVNVNNKINNSAAVCPEKSAATMKARALVVVPDDDVNSKNNGNTNRDEFDDDPFLSSDFETGLGACLVRCDSVTVDWLQACVQVGRCLPIVM